VIELMRLFIAFDAEARKKDAKMGQHDMPGI